MTRIERWLWRSVWASLTATVVLALCTCASAWRIYE
jgi:hypothetical protein